MGISERLQEERKRLGLTQEAAAEKLGATKRSVINWEGGAALPGAEALARYAAAGADVLYVLQGTRTGTAGVHSGAGSGARSASAPALAQAGALDGSRYIQVPHYDVRASAGHGALVDDEQVVDHLVFKREWVVRSMGLDPQELVLIDVRGDSMSPTINDGDLILLDTRKCIQVTEGIYAINLDGRLLVKRLRLRLSGAVEVISDNERYGTETINGEQLAQLHVIGRVVWQGRRI